MEFDEVVQGRRSIRGYLNKPVPKALIREVIELAMRAPTSRSPESRPRATRCAGPRSRPTSRCSRARC